LREDRGWSQDYLAQTSGIGRTHISQLENGRREAGLRMLETLAGAFEVTAAELLKGV
jgi:transcriptional regulator with XRE-family HTH domain